MIISTVGTKKRQRKGKRKRPFGHVNLVYVLTRGYKLYGHFGLVWQEGNLLAAFYLTAFFCLFSFSPHHSIKSTDYYNCSHQTAIAFHSNGNTQLKSNTNFPTTMEM